MKTAMDRVVSGKVAIEGEPLPEESEFFELDASETEALRALIAEADTGELVDGEQFLRELWRRR
jgi:hypothetical protein